MRTVAILLGVFVTLAAAREAKADANTYCVGGFEFDSGTVTRNECGAHAAEYLCWHWHREMFVVGRDGKCRTCWDMCDSTCDTVMPIEHPEFSRASLYDCRRAEALKPGKEQIYVRDGVAVAVAPPPPPPAMAIRADIVRVSPGPYSVGDDLDLAVRAVGTDGKPRPVQGGEVIVAGPDGKEVLRVPVTIAPDGTASAKLKIPAGGALSLRFVPKGIRLDVTEKLGAITSAPFALSVSLCRLRGVMDAPGNKQVLVAGAPVSLRGHLTDKNGNSVGREALSAGMRALFVVDLGGGKTQKVEGTVAADGAVTASFTPPPPISDSDEVAIRLLGDGGAGDLCPGAPAVARLTKLGVGIDLGATPATCYVGMPCRVTLSFLLPVAGDSRAPAEAFVRDPALAVTATLNDEALGTFAADRPGDPASTWTLNFEPKMIAEVALEAIASVLGKQVTERRMLKVREPIVLELPAELDLGTINAGAAWHGTCKTLDFSRSRGVEEQEFRLESTKALGCETTLVANADGMRYPVPAGIQFTVGIDRAVPICLDDVPRCASESPEPVTLTVKALSPDFPDQVRTVRIRWKVTGRSFLSCHAWWIALLAGTVVTAFIAYGILAPHSFATDDAIKLAGKEQGLARATARRLRDLPGGKRGFYRSAATGVREDGSATDKHRQATFVLAAVRGAVVIRSTGGLRRLNRQTRKFEDVPVEKGGYAVSKNVTYQAGSLYFLIT
ncbi:MAG: hypothetical protein EXR73_11090 [Myxococcales bacterium]|nr:hypothetical protein [Myxococcales bacterium]